MSKQLTITATIVARPEKRELVKQALFDLIPPTLKEEGCLNYDLHQDNEDPNKFFFYENWETRDLWLKHLASAHIVANQKRTASAVIEVIINEMSPLPQS